MKEVRTHITIVLDRSGSMESIRDDIIGGFNIFLKKQQDMGAATLTLVQFDTEDSYEVIHSFKAIASIPRLDAATYVPRGGTPLLDAMGRTITNLDGWLNSQGEADRPEQIVVVFITDGQENSSREYHLEQVRKMIDGKKKAGWQFVFLSADLDAVHESAAMGVCHRQSMSFDKNQMGTRAVFSSLSDKICSYRSMEAKEVVFSPEDRAAQESESKRA